MAYPVSVDVQPELTNRNRLTVALRLILAIPHIILVGGIGFGAESTSRSDSVTYGGGELGVIGAVVAVLTIISWFTILLTGRHWPGIRQFTAFYIRWRTRASAYIMLLVDQYPPFGDSAYPVTVAIEDPAGKRDWFMVFFRFIVCIPHYLLLAALVTVWWCVSVIAWLAILVTGSYPRVFARFSVGVLRWYVRVEAYLLLMVDVYPPFSFS